MLTVPQASSSLSLPRAALVALLLEAAFVAAMAVAVANVAMKPENDQTVMLTLSAPTDAAPPKRTHPPVQPPIQRQPPRQHHVDPPPTPAPAEVAATPQPTPARVVSPDPPAIPQESITARAAPDVEATFRSLIRAAIQAAAHDPYAARVAHISGQAQVSFVYRDGQVSGVTLTTSSGYEMLDVAARQAVISAAYPAAPANLAGRNLPFKMWVHIYQTDS